jgi:hypothetical protein
MRNIKAFEKALEDMKREILSDIREIMEKEKYHKFQEPVYIHYVGHDVATTEKCTLLEDSDGDEKFLFETNHSSAPVAITIRDFEDILMRYDFGSLANIYSTLIAELRTEKIRYIQELLQEHNGKIEFARVDGKKPLYLTEGSAIILTNVLNVHILDEGGIAVYVEKSSKVVGKDVLVSNLDLEEINRLLEYVKDATEKTFNVTASNVLSRTFAVKAASWEEAVAKVKAMLEEEPLNADDGLGMEFH